MDDNATASNGHILLVEDDEFLRDLIRRKCEEEGFEVALARDGEEALSVASAQAPDLILLDLILPGMSGFDLMKKLRGSEATAKVPFIVLSNSAEVQNKQESEALGAEAYYVKAETTPNDIVKEITAWFKKRREG